MFFKDSSMDPLRLIAKEMIEIRPFLDIYSLEPVYVLTLIQTYVIIENLNGFCILIPFKVCFFE